MWVDHYNFATTTEYLGIGIWPGKDVAPFWDPETLSEAYLRVLTGDERSSMEEKAKALSKIAVSYGGRNKSAANVAALASQGHT